MGKPVSTQDELEAGLWSLAEPAPAVGPGGPGGPDGTAALVELLVGRGVIDRELADAVIEAIRQPAAGQTPEVLERLGGMRRGLAERFEQHVLSELGRLPSWYRVRVGDPGGPAGAWIERNGRSLRVDVRGAAGPWPSAVGRTVVDEPVLLIVPGRPPAGPDIDLLRRRHARLEIMSWDVDSPRLQQLIEMRLAATHR